MIESAPILQIGGRLSTGWLNSPSNCKCVIDEGRLSTHWLNMTPNLKWVIEGGRLSMDWLKSESSK